MRRTDALKAMVVVGWVGVQGALIATAGARPEHAFGFRMFPEASTLSYSLWRALPDGRGGLREVKVVDGVYHSRARGGGRRRHAWRDWVHQGALGRFDQEIFASYGADAQLSRLRLALDAFAGFVTDDEETDHFVLTGIVRRNGGAPEPFRFDSRPVPR